MNGAKIKQNRLNKFVSDYFIPILSASFIIASAVILLITVDSIKESIKSEKYLSLKHSTQFIEYRLEAWKNENIYSTIFNLTETSKNILNDTSFNPEYLLTELKPDKNLINYRSEVSAIVYNDSIYQSGSGASIIEKELFLNNNSSFYNKENKTGYLIIPAVLRSGKSFKFIFKIDYEKMLSEAVKYIDLSNSHTIGFTNNYDLLFTSSNGNGSSLNNYFELTASQIDIKDFQNKIEVLENDDYISAVLYDKELNLLINLTVSRSNLYSQFYNIRTLIYSTIVVTVIIALVLMFALLTHKKNALQRLEEREKDLEKQISLRTKDLAKANVNVQRNAKRIKAVIENAGDAIITVYENGIIRYFNKAAVNIFNYNDDEIKGRHFNFLLPRRERRYFNMLLTRYRKNPQENIIGKVIEVYCKRKDGTIFPAEMSLSEIEFEEKHLFTCIVKDITLRKKYHEQLMEASKAADKANEAKSAFLANMSHELRTPLNGILGYAQILERDKTLTEKQIKGINIIKNSGEHLLSLINDILDLSKIEAQKFELNKTDFDLEEQLKTVISLIKIKAEQKGIEFEMKRLSEIPKIVYGDSKVIKQVFLNLLGNGVKFTDKGKLTLSIGYRNNGEEILYAEVEDTGIGIAHNKIAEIFEPFKQIQSGSHTIQGTGLGLSITQKLISLMNGRIQVESTLHKGSKFIFEIELKSSSKDFAEITDNSPNIIGFSGKTKKIIAVDDNKTNLDLYNSILSSIGFEIDCCISGQEAIAKMNENNYDLILMDLIMPEMNGYETAKLIKENSKWDEIPIIVVSASTLSENELLYNKSVFNNYLLKPFNNSELINLIGRHLNIEWKYENRADSIDSTVEEEINYPDNETLQQILQYAELGDFKKIEEELSQLSNKEGFGRFINLIKEYIKDYDDEGLIQFLKNIH